MILSSDFWDNAEGLFDILKPVTQWAIALEGNDSKMSKVVQAFSEVGSHINEVLSSSSRTLFLGQKEKITNCLKKKKDMTLSPVHYAANLLDPVLKGSSLTSTESLMGSNFIFSTAKKLNLNCDRVMLEFADFKVGDNDFKYSFLDKSMDSITPLKLWNGFYSNTELRKVANEILNVPPTSASTERTFSTFSWLYSAKRDNLTTPNASMLTYIVHNIRMFDDNIINKILRNSIFEKTQEMLINVIMTVEKLLMRMMMI